MAADLPLSSERAKVSVLGGGAWGTALALHAGRKGHDVLIWAREPEVVEAVNTLHENTVFFKGHKLPDTVRCSADGAAVAAHGDLVLVVIPTPFVERVLAPLAGALRADQILVSCTKGILNDTLETPDAILKRVLPPRLHSRLAFLSGPSFAAEVALEHPTAVTLAAEDEGVARRAAVLLSTPRFRCYTTTDVAGVELGGALKNVLAIAAGISDGVGFGNNARAALITRGLSDLSRLAVKRGANPLTLSGLSGVGDIILTCTGDLSRNRTVGLRLGRGEALADVMASMGGAHPEGVLTSKAAHDLAEREGVECPVISGIYKVIHEGRSPAEVVAETMSRPLKAEAEGLLPSSVDGV